MHLDLDLDPADEALFREESLEQIEHVEQGLLTLERGADTAVLHEVFRAAHTLKGSAGAIGHRRMAELTHAMEDVFGGLRSGRFDSVRPFADVLLATIDVLRTLVDEVRAGETLTDAPETLTGALRAQLAAATGDDAAATPAGGAAPDPTLGRPADRPSAAATDDPLLARLLDEVPAHAAVVAECLVDPASPWQAVRLLQLTLEAADSGRLLAAVPSREEIEDGEPGARLLLALDLPGPDHVAADMLAGRLRAIDEVVSVELRPLAVASVAPAASGYPAASVAPASGEGAHPRPPSSASATPGSTSTPEPDRRAADLGPEARGIAADERLTLAGDRLRLAQQTIRIDVARLDELMDLVGELVVHKSRLARDARELRTRLGDDPLAERAEEDAQRFARIAGQIQDQVTGLRMLPVETVFNRFPRVVRDVAARVGKEVELVLEGRETELDRSVLEEVGDPLGHLVRNAIDHGIEPPDVRLAAGKPAAGRLRLAARHADGRVLIEVADDGRGMDPAALRQVAVRRGLLTPEAAGALSDAEALRLIFAPGFSTAQTVTDLSGRGVGMDVVRTNIERLGGRVDVRSTAGAGTVVSLQLPLTLAIVGALLVRSGGRICALPLTGVVETLRVAGGAIERVMGAPVITLRGRVVPVCGLDEALGDGARSLATDPDEGVHLVVVRSGDRELALAVDALVGQQEIVLKSLQAFAGRLRGVAGATVLADGTVGLVVDISTLLGDRRAAARRSAA